MNKLQKSILTPRNEQAYEQELDAWLSQIKSPRLNMLHELQKEMFN